MRREEILETYKSGYLTQGKEVVAVIYTIPMDDETADRFNVDRGSVFQLRLYETGIKAYYEAVPKGYRYPILIDGGEEALDAIRGIVERLAAA